MITIVGGVLGGVILIMVAVGLFYRLFTKIRHRPLAHSTAVDVRASRDCAVQTDSCQAEADTILNLSAQVDLDLINDSYSSPDHLQVSGRKYQEQHTGSSSASSPDHDFSNYSGESSFESC
ncbi:hypothetical protein CHS0354_026267 [Potamilus streckersoni]|uniref:Uncharacterized protein n=1 Tax=Potamilus streckersoni TaxID=2493646 RepID=A0AAE0W8X1_9BIVA|nr:hypothetical protein CHS0354_026267 [Potamilus streckersoni]